MVECTAHLRRNVHDECAAERDVQKLMAAADSKQRFALREHFLDDEQFQKIARRVERANRLGEARRKFVRIKFRRQIITTRQ